VSVSDKTGLGEFARTLEEAGVEIVSTGSTAATIEAAGVRVTRVEEVTGFPECLDGRVKTLHPSIHAGILADLRKPSHVEELKALKIEPFELVVCTLYPFEDTVSAGACVDACIEQIDIGGPSMIRAAAKNHPSVAVLTDPTQYSWAAEQIANGGFTADQRTRLARDAFRHTADYDVAVATWMGEVAAPDEPATPEWLGATWQRTGVLRYGENPHQPAAIYAGRGTSSCAGGIARAEVLGGKAMSFNNYVDADAAWRAARDFAEPAVAIMKHANPCGIAIGSQVAEAHARAHACDPGSAYGGVIAVNREVTEEMALQVAGVFTEVIVAPGYEPAALATLREKKNLRVLRMPAGEAEARELRPISGGVLVQGRDTLDAAGDDPTAWTLAAGPAANPEMLADLLFAWRAVRSVKSNAILLARHGASVGIGMGQVNRVDSCRLAVSRAGEERARGAVAASDAFFPFADGPQVLFEAGVRAIVQPGGSIRDDEVIAAAREAGATLFLTGARHFLH